MPAIINSVIDDSIAQHLDLIQGDEVLFINDIAPKDLIDYRFLTSGEEISLHIKHSSGEEEIIDIEKDEDEDTETIFAIVLRDKTVVKNNIWIL
jgi:C-terminal processing protease CtpA/Prc